MHNLGVRTEANVYCVVEYLMPLFILNLNKSILDGTFVATFPIGFIETYFEEFHQLTLGNRTVFLIFNQISKFFYLIVDDEIYFQL